MSSEKKESKTKNKPHGLCRQCNSHRVSVYCSSCRQSICEHGCVCDCEIETGVSKKFVYEETEDLNTCGFCFNEFYVTREPINCPHTGTENCCALCVPRCSINGCTRYSCKSNTCNGIVECCNQFICIVCYYTQHKNIKKCTATNPRHVNIVVKLKQKKEEKETTNKVDIMPKLEEDK